MVAAPTLIALQRGLILPPTTDLFETVCYSEVKLVEEGSQNPSLWLTVTHKRNLSHSFHSLSTMVPSLLPTSAPLWKRWNRRRKPSTRKADDTSPLLHPGMPPNVSWWNSPLLDENSFIPVFPESLQEAESLEAQWDRLDRLDGIAGKRFQNKNGKNKQASCRPPLTRAPQIHGLDSKSYETTETEDDSQSERSVETPLVPTAIRWADHHNLPLAKTHVLNLHGGQHRLVILLIHPIARKFEFLHVEYDVSQRLTVGGILQQIPHLASSKWFRPLHFTALYHSRTGSATNDGEKITSHHRSSCTELIHIVTCQDYDFAWNEILIAVADTFEASVVTEQASQLLLNAPLRKAVRKAKYTGRALQQLKPDSKSTNLSRQLDAIEKLALSWDHIPDFDALKSVLHNAFDLFCNPAKYQVLDVFDDLSILSVSIDDHEFR